MRIGISAQPNLKQVRGFRMIEDELPQTIIDVCLKNHVTPIIIPTTQSNNAILDTLKILDGVIITGGSDVSPDLYGQKPISNQQN